MANLRLVNGHNGESFALSRQGSIVGSDADVDVRLHPGDAKGRHARVVYVESHYCVEALDEMDGTFVNGRRVVGQRRLLDGDEIRIGGQTLIFEWPESEYLEEVKRRMASERTGGKTTAKVLAYLQSLAD